jgi:Ca2+-binding RTX toxin-like protein
LPPGPYRSLIDLPEGPYITNDIPGCPNKGDVLSGYDLLGTDGRDKLYGGEGEDFKVRGLGGSDELWGGFDKDYMDGGPGDDFLVGGTKPEESQDKSMDFLGGDEGNDVLRGGPGSDILHGGPGADSLWGADRNSEGHEDVLYGGDGNDQFDTLDGQPDKIYCGKGWDRYLADEGGDRYFANDVVDYVDSSCEKKGLPPVA